jgi:hypothetical protein
MADVDASSVSLWFGKHRGVPLAEVPSGYLEWALAEGVLRTDTLRRAVQAELARRGGEDEASALGQARPRSLKAGAPATAPTSPSPGLLAPSAWPDDVRDGALRIVRTGAGVLSGRNEMSPALRRAHSLLIRWLGTPDERVAGTSDVSY